MIMCRDVDITDPIKNLTVHCYKNIFQPGLDKTNRDIMKLFFFSSSSSLHICMKRKDLMQLRAATLKLMLWFRFRVH